MELDTYHKDKGQKMALRRKIKARRIQEKQLFGDLGVRSFRASN